MEARDPLSQCWWADPYEAEDLLFIRLGFIQGDASFSSNRLTVYLGEKDEDVRPLFDTANGWSPSEYYSICESAGFVMKTLPERSLPHTFYDWTPRQQCAFLHGLWSANGSVVRDYRISFRTTCETLASELVVCLGEVVDISPYVTVNAAHRQQFPNGNYECRESYDINISRTRSLIVFNDNIGFIQQYKQKDLASLIRTRLARQGG